MVPLYSNEDVLVLLKNLGFCNFIAWFWWKKMSLSHSFLISLCSLLTMYVFCRTRVMLGVEDGGRGFWWSHSDSVVKVGSLRVLNFDCHTVHWRLSLVCCNTIRVQKLWHRLGLASSWFIVQTYCLLLFVDLGSVCLWRCSLGCLTTVLEHLSISLLSLLKSTMRLYFLLTVLYGSCF